MVQRVGMRLRLHGCPLLTQITSDNRLLICHTTGDSLRSSQLPYPTPLLSSPPLLRLNHS